MQPTIKILDTPEHVAKQFASDLKSWINNSDTPTYHIALSGGSTPKLLFQHLAKHHKDDIQWDKVHFWWGDERMVPPSSEESNFGVTQKMLFNPINIPESNIHRIRGEEETISEIKRYTQEIEAHIPLQNTWPKFDLIILGMGDDGHTASIFPNQMQLLSSLEMCEIAHHPETNQERITLTGRVLNNATCTAFLVTGSNKTEKVKSILEKAPEAHQYPALHIIPENNLFWYLDEAAAQQIS